jgi:hypothetical protein
MLTKNKDGVPHWDGDPSEFEEFQEECYKYEETVKLQDRYLVGPRIAAGLTGQASTAINGKKRGWLSTPKGVDKLVDFLNKAINKPALPDVGQHMSKLFYAIKRKRGEGMTPFCIRHRDHYEKTRRALAKVLRERDAHLQEKEQELTRRASKLSTPERRSRTPSVVGTSLTPLPEEDASDEGPPSMVEELDSAQEGAQEDQQWSWPQGWGWQSHQWDWQQRGQTWGPQAWTGDDDDDDAEIEKLPDLLPDIVLGWMILSKTGLDAQERGVILAATHGSYALKDVEEALRLHWSDEDLRKRDQDKGKSMHAYLGQSDEYETDGELDDEGQAILAAEYQREEEAMAAVRQGQRTLKEARFRQHEVRSSRQFYGKGARPGSSNDSGKGKGSRDRGPPRDFQRRPSDQVRQCLKCGGAHSTGDCPDKNDPKLKAHVAEEEQSHFSFLLTALEETALQCENALDYNEQLAQQSKMALMASDALLTGKAVLDGGATSSLGSVEAVERVMKINLETHGSTRTTVRPSEQPNFSFGNGQSKKCLSTVSLGITADSKAGSMDVHTLQAPGVPILLSIKSLRRMGAIIDFSNDTAVFTKLNGCKLVQLERASSGHQLFPLTTDVFEGAIPLAKPVSDLKQLCME